MTFSDEAWKRIEAERVLVGRTHQWERDGDILTLQTLALIASAMEGTQASVEPAAGGARFLLGQIKEFLDDLAERLSADNLTLDQLYERVREDEREADQNAFNARILGRHRGQSES